MSDPKLTPQRRAVLGLLARVKETDCLPTAAEISERLGRPRGWAHSILSGLAWQGLVATAGIAMVPSTGSTWRITEAGRAALASAGGGDA